MTLKRFGEHLEESVQFNNWRKMNTRELQHEYDIEYQIKPLKGMTGDVWPTFKDFEKAYRKGEVVTVTPAFDRQIGYRSRTRSRDELISLIKGYASYPKFRNEKTIDSIFDALKAGEAMPMPIVLKFEDGSMRIMGGNTRMDIATMLGVKPKVVVVPVETVKEEFQEPEDNSLSMFSEMSLDESLNTVQEYYMTDDTKLPEQVYAAFELDNTNYVASLVKSGKSGIYVAELNRIVSVNKRLWSFKKSSHIRPVLSTFMRVLESSLPFMSGQVRGIIIPVPKDVSSTRFNSFMSRVMRRTFVTKFKEVPVKYNENWTNGKSYVFMIRNGLDPNIVFKTKAYKGFDFGVNAETLDDIGPRRRQPRRLTTKPSTRYSFGGMNVDLSNDDLHQKTKSMRELEVEMSPENKDFEKRKELEKRVTELQDKFMDEFTVFGNRVRELTNPSKVGVHELDDNNSGMLESEPTHIHPAVLVGYMFPEIAQDLVNNGFENRDHIPLRIREKIEQFREEGSHKAKVFEQVFSGTLYGYGHPMINDTHHQNWKQLMQTMALIGDYDRIMMNGEVAYNVLSNKYKELESFGEKWKAVRDELDAMGDKGKGQGGGVVSHRIADYNIEFTQPTTPEFEPITLNPNNVNNFVFRSKNANGEDKSRYVSYDIGYHREVGDLKDTDPDAFKAMHDYTDNGYKDMNSAIRGSYQYIKDLEKGEKAFFPFTPEILTNIMKKNRDFVRAFETIKPLPQGLWVYRNANIQDAEGYKIGDDIIDTGFMSTSLRPDFGMGGNGNSRLTIYLPRGAKVLPALDNSEFKHENEVVLLPASLIRPLEIVKATEYADGPVKVHMKCVYVGSAYKDLFNRIETELESQAAMTEQKNNRSEADNDRSDKYGELPSAEQMKQVQKDIEDGKLNVERPKRG